MDMQMANVTLLMENANSPTSEQEAYTLAFRNFLGDPAEKTRTG
jgi:hypothetical protein